MMPVASEYKRGGTEPERRSKRMHLAYVHQTHHMLVRVTIPPESVYRPVCGFLVQKDVIPLRRWTLRAAIY